MTDDDVRLKRLERGLTPQAPLPAKRRRSKVPTTPLEVAEALVAIMGDEPDVAPIVAQDDGVRTIAQMLAMIEDRPEEQRACWKGLCARWRRRTRRSKGTEI